MPEGEADGVLGVALQGVRPAIPSATDRRIPPLHENLDRAGPAVTITLVPGQTTRQMEIVFDRIGKFLLRHGHERPEPIHVRSAIGTKRIVQQCSGGKTCPPGINNPHVRQALHGHGQAVDCRDGIAMAAIAQGDTLRSVIEAGERGAILVHQLNVSGLLWRSPC
ncbi:hypothetical protein D3C76_1051130 [compost metagenome]